MQSKINFLTEKNKMPNKKQKIINNIEKKILESNSFNDESNYRSYYLQGAMSAVRDLISNDGNAMAKADIYMSGVEEAVKILRESENLKEL